MSSSTAGANWIDGSLYPDRPVPNELSNLPDRVDFIVRVCSAWDFGIIPEPDTWKEILKVDWKNAIDQTRLLTSCAYHVLRELQNLQPLEYLGPVYPEILNDPFLAEV